MASLFANPWYWIIGGTIIAGLELIVPGVFMLWIGLGALVVGLLLTAFPELPISWQFLIFAGAMISSIGSGFLLQRVGRNKQANAPLNQELAGFVGRVLIAADDEVQVIAIESGRLRVQPHQNPRSPTGNKSPSLSPEGSTFFMKRRG